ncbi:IclR family transcriptional regulator [Variovorax sp. WS11]|uniref:IclR family transcriptional regulator n=1 Tax=Variovorax sp. WS11 TaxID=1105204 RepID=UPI000D0D2C00|nr:IclR family transcriptional regulator [Variovorax sp. WS11]NDZ18063.1 IclR family transcriptional regulator [Variovorax sp. WS11]PSL80005.1 IclR family transcriptional regulator [Variovorax sp. WS11]
MDKTLLKGLLVLEILSDMEGESRTIDDVAARIGLTRSNTHRTLQTLIHAGYVERDAQNGGYRSTMKMFALGVRQLAGMDVRKVAPAHMAALAKETGETIHLSVLEGVEVIYIDKIDSIQPIRAYSMIGGRAPAHAVATGKALLSVQPDPILDTLPKKLARFTPATIVDRSVLRTELARAARLGYAVNRGEWREGVGGVAAPIFDGFDRPVAALGISGPLDRLSIARMKELAPAVVRVADALSTSLGHTKVTQAKTHGGPRSSPREH